MSTFEIVTLVCVIPLGIAFWGAIIIFIVAAIANAAQTYKGHK